MTKLSNT